MDAALDDLLVEWLSEIVYWKDAAGVVFHEAPLSLTHEKGQWKIEASLMAPRLIIPCKPCAMM